MATFPILQSGRTAQYPMIRTIEQRSDVISFLDGTDQRSAVARARRRWMIDLAMLDEQELSALRTFVSQQHGSAGNFQFTDPLDGVVYADCSLEADSEEFTLDDHGRSSVKLIIRENPA